MSGVRDLKRPPQDYYMNHYTGPPAQSRPPGGLPFRATLLVTVNGGRSSTQVPQARVFRKLLIFLRRT